MFRKYRALMVPACSVLCPCSADDLVVLDKKETVLQGVFDRLSETEDAMEWK
jgi:hypothetical protein